MNYIVVKLGEIVRDFNENSICSAFQEFSCEQEADIENFLRDKAINYEKANIGKTSIVLDEDLLKEGKIKILAYFTIAQKSVDISTLSNKHKRRILGNYPGRDKITTIASYLIGQLGRGDTCPKDEFTGEQLLNECYHAISEAVKIVGGHLIVLECRDFMFEKFYEKQGFKKLYNTLSEENLYTLYKKINFDEYES